MSVIRVDLNKCIGCRSCVDICPCDVFYLDEAAHKSVMAYPGNCQSCGQCDLNCKGRSLGMTNDMYGYPITAFRGVTTAAMNRKIITMPGVVENFTKGVLTTDPAER